MIEVHNLEATTLYITVILGLQRIAMRQKTKCLSFYLLDRWNIFFLALTVLPLPILLLYVCVDCGKVELGDQSLDEGILGYEFDLFSDQFGTSLVHGHSSTS